MENRALIGNGAITTTADATLQKAATRMVEEGVGSLGVLKGDLLAGIITERDVLRATQKGLLAERPLRRPATSKLAKSDQAGEFTGPNKQCVPRHLEADVSQSERDALIGLPFS